MKKFIFQLISSLHSRVQYLFMFFLNKRRNRNLRRIWSYRENVKEFRKLVKAGDFDSAKKLLPKVYKTLDKAATSIGLRPTFGGGHRTVEAYILDFHGDLYNKSVRLEFAQRLRDEVQKGASYQGAGGESYQHK